MKTSALLPIPLLCAASVAAAGTERFVDERTGVDGWRFEAGAIRVEVIQRLPDQTRAFFLGRGFSRGAVDHLAERCLFQTIVRNRETDVEAGPVVSLNLADWRVLTPEGPVPLILKRRWQEDWQRRGESEAARIAFQWALFPTEQRFRPGDWNMGMTTYPAAPGESIDIRVVWREDGERRSGTIEGAVCGHDSMATEILK